MRLTQDLSQEGVMRSRMEMSPDGEEWTTLFESEARRQDSEA